MELIGSDKLCVILSLFLSYVTVVTTNVAIDKECREKALETFLKRGACHFNVKGKLTSMEIRSRMSSKVRNWTEYHCEFYFNNLCNIINDTHAVELNSDNDQKAIAGFAILAQSDSCDHPSGIFDQLDPQWNISQCQLAQVTYSTLCMHHACISWLICICDPLWKNRPLALKYDFAVGGSILDSTLFFRIFFLWIF